MLTILRYEINQAVNDIKLPTGYKTLSVGIACDDRGVEKISLWCEVEVDDDTYQPFTFDIARFLVFGTGANMDAITNFNAKYIGTVQKSNQYAFHVYEVPVTYNI